MAPEHPFPVPTNDCYVVTKYILESGDEIGDTNKVVLIGDSAGGNCVAVMTQRLNEENVKQPILQILIYPWVQMVLLFMIYMDKIYIGSLF
jgi:acetyl esterase